MRFYQMSHKIKPSVGSAPTSSFYYSWGKWVPKEMVTFQSYTERSWWGWGWLQYSPPVSHPEELGNGTKGKLIEQGFFTRTQVMFWGLHIVTEIVCKTVRGFAYLGGAWSTAFISLNRVDDSKNLRTTVSMMGLGGSLKGYEINSKRKGTQVSNNLKNTLGPSSQWNCVHRTQSYTFWCGW